jgi:DNA-binding NarL/FixJ family response regulator
VTDAQPRLRVVVADDHVPTRRGVRTALEEGGFVVCADVGSGPAAVAAAREHDPDVCLLDVRMPGGGIAAARRIADELPNTQIVMLTVSREDDDLFDALRAGASGYLLKDTDPDRLPLALRGVLSGEAALPRALVARVIEEFRDRGRRRRLPVLRRLGVDLTDREWEVLELLREELSTKDVAARLGISEVTVRRHASSVLQKLDVKDRREALRLLDEAGG